MVMVAPGPEPHLNPRAYFVDPEDPRAPPTHVWNAMTPAERRRVVDALPSDFTLDFLPPPEGDRHFNPKTEARDTLGRHFRRVGRPVYVSGELAVYYPGERVFSADLIAVLDVEVKERDRWVVSVEGKGLDLALEIHVSGDRRKDMNKNVERYAHLGIPEYFVFDRRRDALHGFRLPTPKARVYERIPMHQGRLESRVLSMDLTLLGDKLRFLVGDASIPDAEQLLANLGQIVDDVTAKKDEAERRALELEQRVKEEQKKRKEEQKKRKEAERRLVELQAELERLKRG